MNKRRGNSCDRMVGLQDVHQLLDVDADVVAGSGRFGRNERNRAKISVLNIPLGHLLQFRRDSRQFVVFHVALRHSNVAHFVLLDGRQLSPERMPVNALLRTVTHIHGRVEIVSRVDRIQRNWYDLQVFWRFRFLATFIRVALGRLIVVVQLHQILVAGAFEIGVALGAKFEPFRDPNLLARRDRQVLVQTGGELGVVEGRLQPGRLRRESLWHFRVFGSVPFSARFQVRV